MLAAVGVQVTGAVLMKLLAGSATTQHPFLLIAGVGGVMALNVLRLGIWGAAHRRFPLSDTFPLSALFFPIMLAVAWAFGDAITWRQWLGAALITAGSAWITVQSRAMPPDQAA